jgi:RNA polymerase sigma factor (sigma-70 family)
MASMSVSADAALADGKAPADSGREPLSVQETVRRYHSALLSFLRMRLCIAHDADDVAQESYIRMMQYEGSREISSPSSMLFRIAINVANDLGRSELARRAPNHFSLTDVDLVSEVPSAEREIGACQDLDLLRGAIEQLSPKCRAVFLLSRSRLMTYSEIAVHCGISLKMVEKHISRALAVCAKTIVEGAVPRCKPRGHERSGYGDRRSGDGARALASDEGRRPLPSSFEVGCRELPASEFLNGELTFSRRP